MNTNSKHYELLAIEPWDIMEANFPPEQFVAYLKGNIIKYTLRDKGQALTDAQKIKHYAEKLIEVLETQENDKDNWTITGVGLEKPVFKPIIVKDSNLKVGDRVRLIAYLTGATGTIIRQPVIGLKEVDKENYIVELDEEEGWKATKEKHLVDSEHAWYADDTEIELLQDAEDKHMFKVGDHVRVKHNDKTGTIIRTPVETFRNVDGDSYIVELDKEYEGWTATKERHGVDSQNAWYVSEHNLELLPKKTLVPYKWYDAEEFTVEELKELLPVGTKVLVIEDFTTNNNDYNAVELGKETWLNTTVQNIDKTYSKERTRVGITGDVFFRRYFRIVGEN